MYVQTISSLISLINSKVRCQLLFRLNLSEHLHFLDRFFVCLFGEGGFLQQTFWVCGWHVCTCLKPDKVSLWPISKVPVRIPGPVGSETAIIRNIREEVGSSGTPDVARDQSIAPKWWDCGAVRSCQKVYSEWLCGTEHRGFAVFALIPACKIYYWYQFQGCYYADLLPSTTLQ